MTAPVSPEERAAALAWLEQAISFREEEDGIQYSVVEDERHRATIRRLLAQPTMPEAPTMEMLSVMREAYTRTSLTAIGTGPAAAYYALRAELLKPATREVEVWRVEYAKWSDSFGHWLCLNETFHSEEDARIRQKDWGENHPDHRCIRVTGPHRQEVPA